MTPPEMHAHACIHAYTHARMHVCAHMCTPRHLSSSVLPLNDGINPQEGTADLLGRRGGSGWHGCSTAGNGRV